MMQTNVKAPLETLRNNRIQSYYGELQESKGTREYWVFFKKVLKKRKERMKQGKHRQSKEETSSFLLNTPGVIFHSANVSSNVSSNVRATTAMMKGW